MIPIRDDNPQLKTPIVTYALIALNVISWLLLQSAGSEPQLSASICKLGLIPADLFGTLDSASPIPMVGASGAIGGVMGAYIVLYPRVRGHTYAYFGGFVAGAILVLFFKDAKLVAQHPNHGWRR